MKTITIEEISILIMAISLGFLAIAAGIFILKNKQ